MDKTTICEATKEEENKQELVILFAEEAVPQRYNNTFLLDEKRKAPPVLSTHVKIGTILRGNNSGWWRAEYFNNKQNWIHQLGTPEIDFIAERWMIDNEETIINVKMAIDLGFINNIITGWNLSASAAVFQYKTFLHLCIKKNKIDIGLFC